MDNRTNNFDLIRLFGALEVVCGHALYHFGVLDRMPWIVHRLLDLFPGVPIFFVVSGFLITASFERRRDIRSYARNRVLRIYPGLWACFAVTLMLLGAMGGITSSFLRTTFVPWVLAQTTFVQFFNPGALRGIGVGVINGSLWTIPVELGFYVLLPTILIGLGDDQRRRAIVSWLLAVIAMLSAALWVYVAAEKSLTAKLLDVTPLPHFWMFLIGALVYRHRETAMPFLRDRFGWWLAGYLLLGLTLLAPDGVAGVAEKAALGGVTLSAAFTAPRLAERLLRGNDISYGVYIYHMLVVNSLVVLGFGGNLALVPATIALTCAVAFLSWRFVEQPALLRKRPNRPASNSAASDGGVSLAEHVRAPALAEESVNR